jgi:hypothetical protein
MPNTTPRNVVAARRALERIGCPVMDGGNWSRNSLLEISAESGGEAPNGLPWASYYCDSQSMPFGVNQVVSKALDKHGLYAEWINPGVLGVYNA